MQNTRRLRIQSVIQEELSIVIPRDIKDPRVPSLCVTAVLLSTDASQATVFFTILELKPSQATDTLNQPNKKIRDCLKGLSSAGGFLRKHLAKTLGLRYVPSLHFKEDHGFENSDRVLTLLKTLECHPQKNVH